MTDWLLVVRTDLDAAVRELPVASLPDLLGVLAAASARATLRLTTPSATSAPAPTDGWLTAQQLASELNVKESAVYDWQRQRLIPAERFGRFLRFNLGTVRSSLAQNSKTVRLGSRKRASNRPKSHNNSGASEPLTARSPAGTAA